MFRADLSVEHQMANEPDTGDRGGNQITVVPANGQPVSLHAYWDGLFGGYSTPFGAVFDTFGGNPKKDGSGRYIPNILWATGAEASITDPEVWFSESFEVAKATAYADPVLSGPDPIPLTRQYETNAMRAARSQLALAAARLAKILNDAFTD
jgi:S1/P1 Nuclease